MLFDLFNLKKQAQERVCNHVRSRFAKIEAVPTQGLFNYRCFENAAEFSRVHPGVSVVEVIYIDADDPVLHYINYCAHTGKYLETTLGFYATEIEYFLIRPIHPSSYPQIWREFNGARQTWNNEFGGWLHRLFGVRVL